MKMWMDLVRRLPKLQIELAILISLLFALLILELVLIFPGNAKEENYLEVSLHSMNGADYSAENGGQSLPVIGLDIIKDVISDNPENSEDMEARLATLTAALQTPIPTTTPYPGDFTPAPTKPSQGDRPNSKKPTLTPTESDRSKGLTPTKTPHISKRTTTATSKPKNPPKQTSIVTATKPGSHKTDRPSPTPAPTQTQTPRPSSTQKPTNTQPSPTSRPQPTNTPQPTSIPQPSNTPAPTQPSNKPTNTPKPPQNTPKPTRQPGPTKAPKPTQPKPNNLLLDEKIGPVQLVFLDWIFPVLKLLTGN